MNVQVHQIDQKDRPKRRLVYKKDQPKGRIKPTKKRSVEKKFKWKRKIQAERLNDPSKEEKNGYPDNMPKAWLIPCTSISTQE